MKDKYVWFGGGVKVKVPGDATEEQIIDLAVPLIQDLIKNHWDNAFIDQIEEDDDPGYKENYEWNEG